MPMICSSAAVCVKNVVRLGGNVQRQMNSHTCNVTFRAPSGLCFLHISSRYPELNYTHIPASRRNSCLLLTGSQSFQQYCLGSSVSKQNKKCNLLTVRSIHNQRSSSKTCLDISFGTNKLNCLLLSPRQARIRWSQRFTTAWLFVGLLVCYSSSNPVHAETPEGMENSGDNSDSSSVSYSHGKKVYTDYSVIGIPGDGRCLFRSVAHGACLRAGKPAPDESLQRQLADELRTKVTEEFVKRREETEWFIEGDFDTYVSQMRKPHVWGGEPELFMASHVLQMPITVFMHDQDAGGLISIAEYGQEYGKENPIKVLYHGFGHYDALQIPGEKNNARSRL